MSSGAWDGSEAQMIVERAVPGARCFRAGRGVHLRFPSRQLGAAPWCHVPLVWASCTPQPRLTISPCIAGPGSCSQPGNQPSLSRYILLRRSISRLSSLDRATDTSHHQRAGLQVQLMEQIKADQPVYGFMLSSSEHVCLPGELCRETVSC